MPLNKMGNFTFNHAAQADTPTDMPNVIKQNWDSRANELKIALNNAIDALKGTNNGDSGADNLGATEVAGLSGTTVQALLEALKNYTDNELATKSDANHNHAGTYESTFTKKTAFNKDFGNQVETVCQGNDSRLSDARTPKSHTHDDRYYTKTKLGATTDSVSGADLIGVTAIDGLSGDTVQMLLEALKILIDTKITSNGNSTLSLIYNCYISSDNPVTYTRFSESLDCYKIEFDGTYLTGGITLYRKAYGTGTFTESDWVRLGKFYSNGSFAQNKCEASGIYSHAEGSDTKATGDYSHAEGCGDYGPVTASGESSHAEGCDTEASGTKSHAEGDGAISSSYASHAEGLGTIASGVGSHSEGGNTNASGAYSHAGGIHNRAKYAQTIIGRYGTISSASNVEYSATAESFMVGNGTGTDTRGLAFKVMFDGKTYADDVYSSSGADYAEMFEWADGNTAGEDRVGFFVTLDGDKIRKANSINNCVLGIVSATPTVLGDSAELRWQGKYLTDDWGRVQYCEVEVPEELDNKGEVIVPVHTEKQPVYNSEWDNTLEYVPRQKRPEWSAVGMMGKLLVRDDGTCAVNGYCLPNDEGIATASTSGYRVMKRIAPNIVQVLLK